MLVAGKTEGRGGDKAGGRAVLLLAFGGPESLEEIPAFLENLTGRRPAPALVESVAERYRLVGGRSPLPAATRAQARALEEELRAEGNPMPVYVGMRYARPAVAEALAAMAAAGLRRVAAISLAPYRARVSTGAYEDEVRAALGQMDPAVCPEVRFARDWHLHPGFIAALAERLEEGMAAFPPERRSRVPVVFTAHSLPAEHVRQGDPYVDQIRATIAALIGRVGPLNWRLAYQSRGAGGGEWLGPQVEEVLEELAAAGEKEVLLDPIGFVADHMETLYDNDVLHRRRAEELGLRFARCACLNTAPAFIAALADIARRTLADEAEGAAASRGGLE